MDLELNYKIKNNKQVIKIISEKFIGLLILDRFKEHCKDGMIITDDILLIKEIITFFKEIVNTRIYLESHQFQYMIDNIDNIDYLSIDVC